MYTEIIYLHVKVGDHYDGRLPTKRGRGKGGGEDSIKIAKLLDL